MIVLHRPAAPLPAAINSLSELSQLYAPLSAHGSALAAAGPPQARLLALDTNKGGAGSENETGTRKTILLKILKEYEENKRKREGKEDENVIGTHQNWSSDILPCQRSVASQILKTRLFALYTKRGRKGDGKLCKIISFMFHTQ